MINHGSSYEPIVAIKDGAGSEVDASVIHPSTGVTHIEFNRPTSGRARLI